MSRYVEVAAPSLTHLDEVAEGLKALGLTVEYPRRPIMLEGSVECPGQPVDLRLAAGTLDSVEDFGFVRRDDGVHLVCGELDRELLLQMLLAPLRQTIAEARVQSAAAKAGLEITPATEVDGRRRLVLRRRG